MLLYVCPIKTLVFETLLTPSRFRSLRFPVPVDAPICWYILALLDGGLRSVGFVPMLRISGGDYAWIRHDFDVLASELIVYNGGYVSGFRAPQSWGLQYGMALFGLFGYGRDNGWSWKENFVFLILFFFSLDVK